MSSVALIRPLTIAAIGGTLPNVSRLLTPDPKEAAIDAAGGARTIDIDLGAAVSIDTLFLGYTNDPGTGVLTVTSGTAAYTTTARGTINVSASDDITPRPHFAFIYAAPFVARYIRISATLAAGYTIGVAAVGLAFQPTWGMEFGEGRIVEDTGSVERLLSGGFGIDVGVSTTGWEWTLGDLQPAEVTALYALVRNRGTTRSLLAIEDPAQTAGLSERCHWGLFRKLNKYERIDPLNTRWDLSIWDWA